MENREQLEAVVNTVSAATTSAPGNYTMYAKIAVGALTISAATYVLVSRYSGQDLIRRFRR